MSNINTMSSDRGGCPPVVLHSATVLVHGCGGAHAIEQLILLPIMFDGLPSRLIVASKHSPQHNKVSTCTCEEERERVRDMREGGGVLLHRKFGCD